MSFTLKRVAAKTILSKSGLPDVDWVINPYTGCRIGCKYCYAAFVGRFKHKDEEWGSYVDVKTNAPELLEKELTKKLANVKAYRNTPQKRNIGTIFLSSVTDPYQGIEAKYQLTRKCLQVLIDLQYEGKVSILTKSSLVLRDIDLFKQLKDLEVGLTITSTGDPISKYLETYATPHEERLKTLRKLNEEGIATYAFVGPLLPHFVFQEEKLKELLSKIKKAGAGYIYLEHLNLSKYIRDRLFKYLEKDYPEALKQFEEALKPEYREQLDRMLEEILKHADLPLAHERAIYHKDKKSWGRLEVRKS